MAAQLLLAVPWDKAGVGSSWALLHWLPSHLRDEAGAHRKKVKVPEAGYQVASDVGFLFFPKPTRF